MVCSDLKKVVFITSFLKMYFKITFNNCLPSVIYTVTPSKISGYLPQSAGIKTALC